MASHDLAYIDIDDDLRVFGYSIAGEETVIAVPQLDVCFDIGKAPEQVVPINNVLLTHGHIDHASGIAYYLSHRNFCDQKEGTVLVPKGLVKPIRKILDAWGELDGNEIPCNLVGVEDGDEYMVKPNIVAKVFDTSHNRNSVGYSLVEVRKKLKKEYIGLSGQKLVALKKDGIEIENKIEMPLVSYLGDTCAADYYKLDHVRKSKVLITECTFFLEEHKDRAKAGRHIHVDHLGKFLEKMENEHIILMHFSQRTHIKDAKKILQKRLPREILDKTIILMDRFDARRISTSDI